MNIGIFIGGTPNRQIDCREIFEKGNPGIGGTEYEFLMLATFLNEYSNSDDYKLTVFQPGKYILKDSINSITGIQPADMLVASKTYNIDILIIDSRWPLKLIKQFNNSATKLIVWCHCVGSIYRHLLFAKWAAVARVVFVSRGHYLNFIDNPVVRKASYAFNAVSIDEQIDGLRKKIPYKDRPHDVVFMGALDESKGFHVLAKAWPEVLKRVPDARLHVIGSANLYGGNSELGPLGIASKKYEKRFGKYLATKENKLHQSVILHGQLATEKYDIMSQCRVGVPNPDGFTETFCICAVEMQSCGCKVVTKWSSGYIDTIPTPNVLVKRKSNLANKIADALLDDNFDCTSNINNIRKNFSIESVGKKWLEIISNIISNSETKEHINIPNQFILRKYNSLIRKYIPIIPPLGLIKDTTYRFFSVLKRKSLS